MGVSILDYYLKSVPKAGEEEEQEQEEQEVEVEVKEEEETEEEEEEEEEEEVTSDRGVMSALWLTGVREELKETGQHREGRENERGARECVRERGREV